MRLTIILKKIYDHSSSYSKNDGSATFESEVFYLTVDATNYLT